MSYRNVDPRIQTDLQLDLSKLNLSEMADYFGLEIRNQIITELRECAAPGWEIYDVAHNGLELRDGALYIVDAQATDASFDRDKAREYYTDDNVGDAA